MLLLITLCSPQPVQAQPGLSYQRERGQTLLKLIQHDLKDNYYDPTFHGTNIEAVFQDADENIKAAQSTGEIFGIIAQVLSGLDDSHTFFIPPTYSDRVEYGVQIQAFGEKVLISAVKPGSDADNKGVKVGDEVLSFAGFKPTRNNLWKLTYLFYTLRPQSGIRLILQNQAGQQRQVDLIAKVSQGKLVIDLNSSDRWDLIRESENEGRLQTLRYVEVGKDLFIWKLPSFEFSESQIETMVGKARKYENLILDLRGNPGGYLKILEWFLGYFVDKDTKIAELKQRKDSKLESAKPHGGRNFKGKLIVLVDSKSASAAEIFARTAQLEKRGTVIGDRTAGAVMTARSFRYELGADTVVFYGASVTMADVIMSDGKSLEKTGVLPDELLVPSAMEIAVGRDPVLARAASLMGIRVSPEQAGAMFPIEWRK